MLSAKYDEIRKRAKHSGVT